MTAVAMLSMHTSPLAQPGQGDSGGMNVYVRELAAALAQGGVDVRVFVRRDAPHLPDRVAVEPGFEVVHVDAGPWDQPKEHLRRWVDDFADAVAADLDRRPADVLHANYWLSGEAAHRLKHERSLPLVVTFHTLGRVKAAGGDPESAERIAAEAAVMGCADVVCASNPVEAAQLVELCDAPAERIELVPLGVDHAFFSPGERAGARAAVGLGEEPVVLFAGRLQALKGVDLAVEALAMLRTVDTALVVIGGPSGSDGAAYQAAVRARVDELGLVGRVRFVPPQPHHLLSTWYRTADLVVVPSRSESFGLVALEAAACGVPVVASGVGGLASLVEDGVTGLLLGDRDPRQWATAIDDLLADPGRRTAMGAAAAGAAQRYRWSIAAARLRRCYADLHSAASLVSCT